MILFPMQMDSFEWNFFILRIIENFKFKMVKAATYYQI